MQLLFVATVCVSGLNINECTLTLSLPSLPSLLISCTVHMLQSSTVPNMPPCLSSLSSFSSQEAEGAWLEVTVDCSRLISGRVAPPPPFIPPHHFRVPAAFTNSDLDFKKLVQTEFTTYFTSKS